MNNNKERVFLAFNSLLCLYLFYFNTTGDSVNHTYSLLKITIIFSFCWLLRRLYPNLVKETKNEIEDESKPQYYLAIDYLKNLANIFADIFFVWIIFCLIRILLLDIQIVPSGSMQPNLVEGDRVLVSKITFGLRAPWNDKKILISKSRTPLRGEMVCFVPPKTPFTDGNKTYVKRVIGIPGDTIKISRDKLEVIPKGLQDKYDEYPSDFEAKWTINPEEVSNTTILLTTKPIIIYEELLKLTYPIQFIKYHLDESKPTETIIVPEGHYFLMGDNRNNSEDSRIFGCVPKENITSKPLAILYNYDSQGSIIPKIKFDRFFKKINNPTIKSENTDISKNKDDE